MVELAVCLEVNFGLTARNHRKEKEIAEALIVWRLLEAIKKAKNSEMEGQLYDWITLQGRSRGKEDQYDLEVQTWASAAQIWAHNELSPKQTSINYAFSDESLTHIVSVRPVMLTKLQVDDAGLRTNRRIFVKLQWLYTVVK